MLKNGVAVYWHGQLWISAQTCALALFYYYSFSSQ